MTRRFTIVPGGDPPRASRFFAASELSVRPVPEREWLAEGLIPMKTVTLFSGDGAVGKSMVALQASVAVVTGEPWLGRPVRPGRALFLTAEDDEDELHRRIDIIRHANGKQYEDLAGLTIRSLAGEDALLAVETQLALIKSELFSELEARAEDDGACFICVDTAADTFPANENDRAKVRQFIGLLRGLALRQSAAVMLIAHPSLTGLATGSGLSGSTAWNNSVRSRLYLERVRDEQGYEPDPDRRLLTSKKSNYGPTGEEIAMRWQDGVFVGEEPESGLDRQATGMKAERVFLALLREVTAQGRRVNALGGVHYAPKLFADLPSAEGCTKRALRAAMERLLKAGKLVIKSEGPPSRRVSYLAEVAHG